MSRDSQDFRTTAKGSRDRRVNDARTGNTLGPAPHFPQTHPQMTPTLVKNSSHPVFPECEVGVVLS